MSEQDWQKPEGPHENASATGGQPPAEHPRKASWLKGIFEGIKAAGCGLLMLVGCAAWLLAMPIAFWLVFRYTDLAAPRTLGEWVVILLVVGVGLMVAEIALSLIVMAVVYPIVFLMTLVRQLFGTDRNTGAITMSTKRWLTLLAVVGVALAILLAWGYRKSQALDIYGSPLHVAAAWGDTPRIRQLIDNGADPNSTNDNGLTPLHLAANCGQAEAVNLLLANGADVDAADRIFEMTPLHLAAVEGSPAVVRLLVAGGANVNAEHNYGATPLHLAAVNGHAEVTEVLLANGADVNTTDDSGCTPLDDALKERHTVTAELLRKHGGVARAPTGTEAPLVVEPDPILGSWEAYARSKSVGGPKVGLNEGEWANKQGVSIRWTATFFSDGRCESYIHFDQPDPTREYGAPGTFTWEKHGASYVLLGQNGELGVTVRLHDGGDLYAEGLLKHEYLWFRLTAHDVDEGKE